MVKSFIDMCVLQDGPGVPSFPAPQPPVGSSPPVPPSRPAGRRPSNRVRAPLPPLPRGIKDETWEEQGESSSVFISLSWSFKFGITCKYYTSRKWDLWRWTSNSISVCSMLFHLLNTIASLTMTCTKSPKILLFGKKSCCKLFSMLGFTWLAKFSEHLSLHSEMAHIDNC